MDAKLEQKFEAMLDGKGGYLDSACTPQQKRLLYQALAKETHALIDQQVAEAEKRGGVKALKRLAKFSEVHITRRDVIWGTDHVEKGSQLSMIPLLYLNSHLDEITPPEKGGEQ